jgi:signal transduction histidine kinase
MSCFWRWRDDGNGFSDAAVPEGRLGLAGMPARAGLIGGRLEIDSSIGHGRRMTVAVPAHGTSREPG